MRQEVELPVVGWWVCLCRWFADAGLLGLCCCGCMKEVRADLREM